jgi:hypothetical protein
MSLTEGPTTVEWLELFVVHSLLGLDRADAAKLGRLPREAFPEIEDNYTRKL